MVAFSAFFDQTRDFFPYWHADLHFVSLFTSFPPALLPQKKKQTKGPQTQNHSCCPKTQQLSTPPQTAQNIKTH